MKIERKDVNVGIVVGIIFLIITLIGVPKNSFAQDGLWERLAKREKEFMQLQTDVDIIYKMLAKAFIERYGQEEYENLLWGENATKREKEIKGNIR